MPFLYGKFYPERESAGLLNHRFRILVDTQDNSESLNKFLLELCTLRAYLNDIPDSPAHLEIFVTLPNNFGIQKELNLIPVKLDLEMSDYNNSILTMAALIDADLFVTDNDDVREYLNAEKDLDFLVETYDGSKKNIEIFVRGQEVPWSFKSPSWNMPWIGFYSLVDEFGKKSSEIYGKRFQKIGLDEQTLEMIRSLLLNRIPNICYTKDKLLFYVQQRRYAKRRKWKNQAFQFEVSYYLCHYYLLLWGGIDQLSRILNNTLNLSVKQFSKISVAKNDFVAKINSVNESLGSLYTDEKFVEWVTQLRRNRHYTAHQGSIILSILFEKPNKEASDDELEKEAQTTPRWALYKKTMPQELFELYHGLLKQNIRISKQKVLVDDAMVIKEKEGTYIFRPLGNIEWDFNNFELAVIKTLEKLYEFLQNRK